MTRWLIGVDGGGSKTRARLAGVDGTTIAEATAGSSNPRVVGDAAAREAVLRAIEAVFLVAEVSPTSPSAALCLGLAGLEGRDPAAFEEWAVDTGVAERVSVVRDSELVLASGTADGSGIALIAGTGTVAVGRAPDGTRVQAGGWGWVLGDEGSGFDIGWRALRLATQTADGRAEAAAVLDTVMRTWGASHPTELLDRAHRGGDAVREDIAALARPILELASSDADARGIVAAAAAELAKLLRAVASQLPMPQPAVMLSGGVLVHSDIIREEVVARAAISLGPIAIVADPSIGAVRLAQQLLERGGDE